MRSQFTQALRTMAETIAGIRMRIELPSSWLHSPNTAGGQLLQNDGICWGRNDRVDGRERLPLRILCQGRADRDWDSASPRDFSVSSTASLPERTQSGTPIPL